VTSTSALVPPADFRRDLSITRLARDLSIDGSSLVCGQLLNEAGLRLECRRRFAAMDVALTCADAGMEG
jgi:hypothetical protein